MKQRLVGTLTLIAIIVMTAPMLGLAQTTPDLNNPAYWETTTTHESQCFKHEGDDLASNVHGVLTDPVTVTLNPFNPNWFGDHWELLVLKAGTENFVFDHPEAGIPYSTSGQEVSHWIVCKGLTPDTTTTTSTTTTVPTDPTTSTTTPTTTTRPTTTTVTTTPSSTTSTTEPITTSTLATTTTTTTTTLSNGPSITVPPTTLPFTGIDNLGLYAGYAIALLSAGGLIVLAVRRRQ